MLHRFADRASLDAWESSSQRAWSLGSAQGLVGESLPERQYEHIVKGLEEQGRSADTAEGSRPAQSTRSGHAPAGPIR